MINLPRPSRILLAASMIGLGVTGVVNGDFALAWQHVPLHHLPGRTFIAYLCAVIELAVGIGLLFKSTLTLSCRILFVYLLLWLVLLELSVVLKAPQIETSWADFGEIAIIASGAWCLFASHAGAWEKRHLKFIVEAKGIRAARLLLIISLPMIGLEVIILAATSVKNVLPPWLDWLSFSNAWIYLSGIGSIAACMGMLLSIFPRLATTLEAAMLGIITVVYWGPWLHTGRTATTAFLISLSITAGVWLVADTYRGASWIAYGRASRSISFD